MVYRRDDGGVDHLNDRPVAFWHLQKPFLSMLGAALARPMIGLDPSRPTYRLNSYGFAPSDEWLRIADPYLAEFPTPFDPYHEEVPYRWDLVDDDDRVSLRRYRRAMQQRFGFGPENPFSMAAVCERFFDHGDLFVALHSGRVAGARRLGDVRILDVSPSRRASRE